MGQLAVSDSPLLGTYVLGLFRGISTKDGYRKLEVATVPRHDGDGSFVEELDFDFFDKVTGERVIPEELTEGAYVAVRVWLNAKSYLKDGKPSTFVSKRALQVVAL